MGDTRMDDVIAQSQFLLKRRDSDIQKTLTIELSRPVAGTNVIDYACEIRLVEFPVWDRYVFALHGVDGMQAIEVALGFKNKILHYLKEDYIVELLDEP
jgi:hypothetical protein